MAEKQERATRERKPREPKKETEAVKREPKKKGRKTNEERAERAQKKAELKISDGLLNGYTQGDGHSTFKTGKEFADKAAEYFFRVDMSKEVPSEHGLALHLGVARDTLRKWLDGKSCVHLQPAVERAYNEITVRYMQLLRSGDKNMTSLVIFMLKQMPFGGYQDKTEVKNDSTVRVVFGKNVDASDFK